MQLRIYQRLNQILIALMLSDVVIIGLGIWQYNSIRDNLIVYFVIALVYNLICFFIFKTLENNWDKRMMQKMAISGKIALASITAAKKLMTIKDSGNHRYNIWQFDVNYWDQDMQRREGVVIEKLNPTVTSLPLGNVFITNDEKKPLRRFIIQNVVIGNIPTLMPIVAKYENNKALKIKYLNVYYRDGLVIETFKESLKAARDNEQNSENRR